MNGTNIFVIILQTKDNQLVPIFANDIANDSDDSDNDDYRYIHEIFSSSSDEAEEASEDENEEKNDILFPMCESFRTAGRESVFASLGRQRWVKVTRSSERTFGSQEQYFKYF